MGHCKLDSELFLQKPWLLNKQKNDLLGCNFINGHTQITPVEYKIIFISNQPWKKQIYTFSGFPPIYIWQKAKSKKYTLLNNLCSAYLHEVAEGMNTNVYHGDHCREGKKKRNYTEVLKKHKIISFLKI